MPLEELDHHNFEKAAAVTIGVFDGVHLGHKTLISELAKIAKRENLTSIAITFKTHPREVIIHKRPVPCLTCLEQKASLLKSAGIERVVALPFTRKLASTPAAEFLIALKEKLNMKQLVVGADFALGKDREGNPEFIGKLARQMGFELSVIQPLFYESEEISSTAIRNALASGDIKKANSMLGRCFRVEGTVVKGDGRGGAELGFPTANILPKEGQAIPADGVYAAITDINGKEHSSLVNIGVRPTFGGGNRVVETYIIDYEGKLYGSYLKIDIIGKIRSEQCFSSPEALVEQIKKDLTSCKEILGKE